METDDDNEDSDGGSDDGMQLPAQLVMAQGATQPVAATVDDDGFQTVARRR